MESIIAQPPDAQSSHIENSHRLAVAGCAVRLAEAEREWGWFAVAATPRGVCAATFGHDNALEAGKALEEKLETGHVVDVAADGGASGGAERVAETAIGELLAFFAGRDAGFRVAVALSGTPFQRAVWEETQTIRYGSLATYRDIAKRIGRPQAYRAVGNALGQNPLPVIVPCHRVIASDGTFGGYTRGLPWKERLLALEGSLESIATP